MLNLITIAALVTLASAKVYFFESFNTDSAWEQSAAKKDFGVMSLASGLFSGDSTINQGYKTTQDSHFYATSALVKEPVENSGKELVLAVSVKHEQGLDCGGGYLKFLPAMDAKEFDRESEYLIMFGPDQCGATRRVHLIFHYKGKNVLWKKELTYPNDRLTHVYVVRIMPDNSYTVYIDQEEKMSGKLEEDWAFLEPKMIDDPSDEKPADWVDEAEIDDPTDTKPDDWDDEPEMITDKTAVKPDDWDDEEDGEWEAPMEPNPAYKGAWMPKRIPNPEYKGPWVAKQIANPDYVADAELYRLRKPIARVGIDVWQVKSGTIFDNIVIADSLDEVNKIIDETWKATRDAERSAMEAYDAKKAEKVESADEKPEDEDL